MIARDLAALPPTRGWRASLALGFERRGDRTTLVRREHEGPLMVQKPLYPRGPGVCEAIVLHPPGGIVGGDSLAIDIELGTACEAVLTTPGATKWYRSGGTAASQSVNIRLAERAHLDWLPREQIVFDGALARSNLDVRLLAGSSCLGWEVTCLGRCARGEKLQTGSLQSSLRIGSAERPWWIERGRFAGGDPLLASAVGLGGASVCATLWLAGFDVDDSVLAQCRERSPNEHGSRFAVTRLPRMLLARYLGDSAESAFEWFCELRSILSVALRGGLAHRPRIWAA
jgi:urease accessory protein